MTALLPTEGQSPLTHDLKHVTVTNGGRDHLDAGVPHRMMQAEVRHHRHHEGVVGKLATLTQRKSAQREDLVAVNDLTIGVDGDATVGVPIVRHAGVSAVLHHGGPQRFHVGRATGVVDPGPVPVGMQGDHVSTGRAQHARRQQGRGTLRTVDHDPKPGQRDGHGRQQEVRVALHESTVVTDPPDRRAGGTGRRGTRETFGDLVLDLVRELAPASREQLDAVVRHRVVARREHHAEGRVRADHRMSHRRCGHDTDPQDVRAGRRETGDDRGFQEFPGRPGVTAYHYGRTPTASNAVLGEHPHSRRRQRQCQFGGEIDIGDPAHAIGTEEPRHFEIPRGQRVSACCTEVPSEPSSGRTSYVP